MTPPWAPTRVLFICSRNQWRSPTAEAVFADAPGVECQSAGLNHDAENPLTVELVDWADLIFVMERDHQARLKARFRPQLASKTIVCLGKQAEEAHSWRLAGFESQPMLAAFASGDDELGPKKRARTCGRCATRQNMCVELSAPVVPAGKLAKRERVGSCT